jgi:hypothetical protein
LLSCGDGKTNADQTRAHEPSAQASPSLQHHSFRPEGSGQWGDKQKPGAELKDGWQIQKKA